MRPILNAAGRKDGRTAGTDASHRVALDAFATVAGGGTVEAEVQGRTGAITAVNNRNIFMNENCQTKPDQVQRHKKWMNVESDCIR